MPGGQAGCAQHEEAQFIDLPRRLGCGHGNIRRNIAQDRVRPAQQGLETGQFAILCTDDRLIGQRQFPCRQAVVKAGGNIPIRRVETGRICCGKAPDTAAGHLLFNAEGDFGSVEQIFGAAGIVGKKRQAHRYANAKGLTVDEQRVDQLLMQPVNGRDEALGPFG